MWIYKHPLPQYTCYLFSPLPLSIYHSTLLILRWTVVLLPCWILWKWWSMTSNIGSQTSKLLLESLGTLASAVTCWAQICSYMENSKRKAQTSPQMLQLSQLGSWTCEGRFQITPGSAVVCLQKFEGPKLSSFQLCESPEKWDVTNHSLKLISYAIICIPSCK